MVYFVSKIKYLGIKIMEKKLRNFVITGATAESGQHLCKYIAKDAGSRMVMISRSHNDELDALRNKNIKYFSGIDLTRFDKEKGLIKDIDRHFRKPFGLVHMAGDFWEHETFDKINPKQAMDLMKSQFGTLYSTVYGLLDTMVKKGGGKILTLGDNSTYMNLPNMAAFTASKAAVEHFIKCIANEYMRNNIQANVLTVSSLKTEKNKTTKPNGDFENYISLDDLSREIVQTLQLGKTITGSVIRAVNYSPTYNELGALARI